MTQDDDSQRRAIAIQPYITPSGARVNTAVEMANAIEAEWDAIKPDVLRGHVSRWFATFDQDSARRLGEIEESKLAPDLVVFSFIHTLDPARPFGMVAGERIFTPLQLVAVLERDQPTRALGEDLLERGYLLLWLRLTGNDAVVDQYGKLSAATRENSGLALEALLHLMDPTLPVPSVQASTDLIDFGAIPFGETKAMSLVIENPGRGYLTGMARLSPELPGLSCAANLIRGSRTEIVFRVNSSQITAGSSASTTIEIETNGDRMISIPLRYQVDLPTHQLMMECLKWAAAGGALFGLLRLLLLFTGYSDWLGRTYDYASVVRVSNRIASGEPGIYAEFAVVLALLVAGLAALAMRAARGRSDG